MVWYGMEAGRKGTERRVGSVRAWWCCEARRGESFVALKVREEWDVVVEKVVLI